MCLFKKCLTKKAWLGIFSKNGWQKKGCIFSKKGLYLFKKKSFFFCLLFLFTFWNKKCKVCIFSKNGWQKKPFWREGHDTNFAFFEKIQTLHFLFQIVLGMDTRKPYLLCPRGGIGRRSRFRIYRLTVCRFESDWGYLFFYNITKKI